MVVVGNSCAGMGYTISHAGRYVFEKSEHGAHDGGGYKMDIPLDPVLAKKKIAGASLTQHTRRRRVEH